MKSSVYRIEGDLSNEQIDKLIDKIPAISSENNKREIQNLIESKKRYRPNEENTNWEIPVAKTNVNRALYIFEGDSLNIEGNKVEKDRAVFLDSSQKVKLLNGSQKSRILLLQGKPINDPVVQYGPFVMNTNGEIQEAFSDFQKTRFGGWPWSRNDVVHAREKGRFASFDDGVEITKD